MFKAAFHIPVSGQQVELILELDETTDIGTDIEAEVLAAQRKFPKWPADLNYGDQIINEEKGEATQALLDICQGKATLEDAEKEYIQTAAMCIRQIAAIRRLKEGINGRSD